MKEMLSEAIVNKINSDIFIIGNGPSIDGFDYSLIKSSIVINVNDSERRFAGDISVLLSDKSYNYLLQESPKCKLYVAPDRYTLNAKCLHAEYINQNPDNADFIAERFFDKKIYLEQSTVISALRVANEIAKRSTKKINVYLLGFDFSNHNSRGMHLQLNDFSKYDESVLRSQEMSLRHLMKYSDSMNINIIHVGTKEYSQYTVAALESLLSDTIYHDSFPCGASNYKYKVAVVAEITTNHFGDMSRLKAMIKLAKLAGADYVKLQKRDVETFYSLEKLNSKYESPFGDTFRDYRNQLELNRDEFDIVDKYCKDIGIKWFASVLDYQSYLFIKQYNPDIIKLPSTISEHKDFLSDVANDFYGDIVISTGYTDPSYEEFILNTFNKAKRLFLLQCTSSYPTANFDAQIGIVRHYYNISKLDARIVPGYSSHDIGSTCSMLSVAAGALMVEKHVKLGNVSWSHFDDVAVDLTTNEFCTFVNDIRNAERIVGDELKTIKSSEHHKYWK